LVLGLDADPAALRRVGTKLASALAAKRLRIVKSWFGALETIAAEQNFTAVDAILLDLGLSSFQLETSARGFAFGQDGPLDMRFDPLQESSAADIINSWSEAALADLFYQYGEEPRSRRIARMIVEQRPIVTTAQLASTIERAVGGRRGQRTHPATQIFQALRIVTNRELEQLEAVLPQALRVLRPGGRLAVISFHSLEDRIVKQWMQHEASTFVPDPTSFSGRKERTPTIVLVNRKPIVATPAEVARNPRSRSAKLRIAEKL